jgi:hypothetical protein
MTDRGRPDDQIEFSLSALNRGQSHHRTRPEKQRSPRSISVARRGLAAETTRTDNKHVVFLSWTPAILFWQATARGDAICRRHGGIWELSSAEPLTRPLFARERPSPVGDTVQRRSRSDRRYCAILINAVPPGCFQTLEENLSNVRANRRPVMRAQRNHSAQPLISRFRVLGLRRLPALGAGFVSAGHIQTGDHGPLCCLVRCRLVETPTGRSRS